MRVYIISSSFSGAYDAYEGENLLAFLHRNQIPIGNSCQRGDCKQCLCAIVSIMSQSADHEKAILACQTYINSDLTVRLRDNDLSSIPVRYFPGKIHEISTITDNIISLQIRIPSSVGFAYRPGQYLEVKATSSIQRPYSIANFDKITNIITFNIKKLEGGLFGSWLTQDKVGRVLTLKGPMGNFFIKDNLSVRETLFLATGTGIVPVFNMLENISASELNALGRIGIFVGNRFPEDNYLHNQIKSTASKIGAEYKTVYSQATPKSGFRYVTELIPASLKKFAIFAAGNPLMIQDVFNISVSRGLSMDNFYADAFTISDLVANTCTEEGI